MSGTRCGPTRGRRLGSLRLRRGVGCWLALAPLTAVILFPYLVMLSTALKPDDEIFAFPPTWLPGQIALANFARMWQASGFGQAMLNSLIVSVASTVFCLLVAVFAAYAMARLRFRGQRTFSLLLLVTQMLSPVVLIIGLFRLMAALGLVNQLWSLILAYAGFNLAFSIWMLQSYFRTIPRELEEAACLDGADWLTSLRLIFLPLAAPALGVTAIFSFVNCWTEFVLALTFLRSPEKLTLTLRVASLVSGAYHVDWNLVMAATLVATVPVAIVFALLQRYLVRGLALGAIK